MYRKKKVVKPTTVEVLKEELRHQLVYGESVRSLGTEKTLNGTHGTPPLVNLVELPSQN